MTEETLRIVLILLVAFVITGLEKRKSRQKYLSVNPSAARYTLLNRRKSHARRTQKMPRQLPNQQVPIPSLEEASAVLK